MEAYYIFSIKKQTIFYVGQVIKGLLFLIDIVCSMFGVFRGGWVVLDVLCGNVDMDNSTKVFLISFQKKSSLNIAKRNEKTRNFINQQKA